MPRKAGSLGEVPDEFLRCRAFRNHREFHVHDRVVWKGTGKRRRIVQVIREEVCPNCGRTLEVVYLLPGWEVMSRRTYYPDLYLVEGGVDATDAKQEWADRMAASLDVEPDERPDNRKSKQTVSTGKKGNRRGTKS